MKAIGLSAATLVMAGYYQAGTVPEAKKPNFIIIFADDLGYGDLGCYGSKIYQTPHLDRMAAEGMRFTDFYATCSVCSPSRASLLTGRYPSRCGIPFAVGGVYSDLGLQDDEITIAELLKERGYATACIGKWHLGVPEGFDYQTHEGFSSGSEFHPNRQGFDLFYGVVGNAWPDGSIPVLDGDHIVEPLAHVSTITEHYTRRTIEFINEQKDKSFFVYLSHTRTHAPWMANPQFGDPADEGGMYGAMLKELDWSTGEILKILKELDLDDNTLVIFTSDNGAAYTPDQKHGSNLPLRGGKTMTWEGGLRVPAIFRWPGKIPARRVVSGELVTVMDLLPTIAYLAGVDEPSDRIVDGKDIWPLISGAPGAKSPHEMLYYYNGLNLQAIRSGEWKLHLPRTEEMLVWWEGGMRRLEEPMLFNLEADIGEERDLANRQPDVVARLPKWPDRLAKSWGHGTGEVLIRSQLNT
ncbi:sulfatase [Acidobacteria bacterium AH-259-O06]|nr:sulfatase [Acidobacteria bacterium AH-259-O06]